MNKLLKEGVQIPQLKLDEFIECTMKKDGYRSKSEFTIGRNIDK